jgi:hypothetical protein
MKYNLAPLAIVSDEHLAFIKRPKNSPLDRSRPQHSIRISPGSGISAQEALARLRAGGVEATASEFLPTEFIRIQSGLQVRPIL